MYQRILDNNKKRSLWLSIFAIFIDFTLSQKAWFSVWLPCVHGRIYHPLINSSLTFHKGLTINFDRLTIFFFNQCSCCGIDTKIIHALWGIVHSYNGIWFIFPILFHTLFCVFWLEKAFNFSAMAMCVLSISAFLALASFCVYLSFSHSLFLNFCCVAQITRFLSETALFLGKEWGKIRKKEKSHVLLWFMTTTTQNCYVNYPHHC